MKSTVIAMLRAATRGYVRRAPWIAGKRTAYDLFSRHVGWRPHRTTVRTRYGDLMDLTIPDAVSSTIYLTGQWEPVITQYIRANLTRGDTFIDCGANIGYYSLLASRIVGPSGHVVSIEPSPSIFSRLQRNLALNRCQNVRALNAAASGEKGELSIYLADKNNLGHTTTVEGLAKQEGMQFEARVRADALEALAGQQALYRARFIKIDVEGAELTVLRPLLHRLDAFDPRTEWLLEFSPDFSAGGQADVNEIHEAFTRAGYTAWAIPNEYRAEFVLDPPASALLEPLSAPPSCLCDVLMSRTKNLVGRPRVRPLSAQ